MLCEWESKYVIVSVMGRRKDENTHNIVLGRGSDIGRYGGMCVCVVWKKEACSQEHCRQHAVIVLVQSPTIDSQIFGGFIYWYYS